MALVLAVPVAFMGIGPVYAASAPTAIEKQSPLAHLADQAGILPTSPFYGLKRLFESLDRALTVGSSGQLRLLTYLAEVRAAEAAAMDLGHHSPQAKAALAAYATNLAAAESMAPGLLSGQKGRDSSSVLKALLQATQDGETVLHDGTISQIMPAATLHAANHAVATGLAQITVATNFASTASKSTTLPMQASAPPAGLTFLALLLSVSSHTSMSHVTQLYDQSHSWAQVAADLHVTLSQLLAALNQQSSQQLLAQDTVSTSPSTTSNTTGSSSESSASTTGNKSSTPTSDHLPSSSPTTNPGSDGGSPSGSNPVAESKTPAETPDSVTGSVSAVSSTGITVNGTVYQVGTGIPVTYHDHQLTLAAIPSGATVRLSLSGGTVTAITVMAGINLPPGDSVQGSITALQSQTVTIAGYPLQVEANVPVRYHDFRLSWNDVKVGMTAKMNINTQGIVTAVTLLNDPNLPAGGSVSGTITQISGSTITIDGYKLGVVSAVPVSYQDYQLTWSAVKAGMTAKVNLDSQGMVNKIQLQSDPNLPASDSLTGPVSAVGSSSITLDGYTLPIEPGVTGTDNGQTYALAQIQPGWTVKVNLDNSGAVSSLHILSGPPTSSSNN